jgi:hypothetical protein
MNGFLSNLSARSFDVAGASALVRPRLPSLFEPVHPKWGDLPELPAGSEPGEETGNSGRESTRWADGPESVQLRHNLQQETGPYGLPARPMTDGDRVPPHPAGKGVAAADKDRAGGSSGYETLVHHVSRAIPQQLTAPEIPARTTPMPGPDRQSDKAREELPTWSERPPRRIAAPDTKVEEAEIGDRIKQLAARIMKARGEGSEKRMNAAERPAIHPAGPAAPPWDERKFQTVAAKPEPTIQVTIGRIEVRASVSPQTHTTKPLNKPPLMGLEEYLHRRSGGRNS